MAEGPRKGVYLLSAYRIRCGWGAINETRWPYSTKGWPPIRPHGHDGFDRIASYTRIAGYLPVRRIAEAKSLLRRGMQFQLTVPTTPQWYNSTDGRIAVPRLIRKDTFKDTHAIWIVAYDDLRKHFVFRNSWGEQWGDRGYGYLPYSYVLLYMFEAWAPIPVLDIRPELPPSAYALSPATHQSPAGHLLLHFSVYGHDGEKVGWCFTQVREGFLDVDDFFVKPGYDPDHALVLTTALLKAHRDTGLPIRFWISHCDASPGSYNHDLVHKVVVGLELTMRPARERWANSVATWPTGRHPSL